MNDEIFKSKGFWYTVAGGIVALNPGLLVPIAGYIVAKAGCKGVRYAIETSKVAIQEAARRRRERKITEQWERERPERERRFQEEQDRLAADQKTREDARAACELLYHVHAHVLKRRLPKETFLDFLTRYMGDNHPAAYVEERGRQLRDLILQHVHRIEPPPRQNTIQSLTQWYQEMRAIIEALPVDARSKQVQLAQLNVRFAELSQELMETLEP